MRVNKEKSPLKEDPREEVRRSWQGAVLLRDEIEYYCRQELPLIEEFDLKHLKPASYHLRLGRECWVDGKRKELSAENPTLTIPPHGMAIVSTYEKVNIPGFLIARWNLKVKKVYEGLLWVGGPQVDPGYHGILCAPLYNLSTEPVHLKYCETLFTIDFVRTTPYDESKGCKLWESDRATDSCAYLNVPPLKSGIRQDLDKMEGTLKTSGEKLEHFQLRIDTFQVITFTVLGIIVAALAFMGTSQFGGLNTVTPSNWQIATWIIMLLAILILTGVLAYAGVQTMLLNKKKGGSNGKNNKL